MTAPGARQAAVRIVLDVIRDAGWTNRGEAALAITTSAFDDPTILNDSSRLAAAVPDVFFDHNRIGPARLRDALSSAAGALEGLARSTDPLLDRALIQISDIDSFAKAKDVPATVVRGYVRPLRLPEDTVERIIAAILGEPYRQKDWGGELDDMFSAQVRLGGRDVTASFMLKGPAVPGILKPRNLGSNGDQITRMTSQPAELFVVQHVNKIDSAVYRQLTDAVVARRAQGQPHVVGSVWNGVDTARLGVAYGFLEPHTGELIPDALPDE